MARQIVAIPAHVLDALYRRRWALVVLLGELEFDTDIYYEGVGGARSISMSAYAVRHGTGPRSAMLDCELAVVLVAEGSSPRQRPRPLPDEITLQVLDTIEQVLTGLEGITGHDSLAIAEAVRQAR